MDEDSKKEKHKRVSATLKNNDEYQEYGMAFIKIVLAAIVPYGPILNEVIDARSSVKAKRVEKFVLEFAKYLNSKSHNYLDLNTLKQENIGDILEDIITSVSRTSSEQKLIIFKNILYDAFNEPDDEPDIAVRYISITNRISTLQFRILKEFELSSDIFLKKRLEYNKISDTLKKSKDKLAKEKTRKDEGLANNYKTANDELNKIEKEYGQLKDDYSKLANPNLAENYGLDNNEFIAEIQDLIATGLLYHFNAKQQNMHPIYALTKQGRRYMNYLRRD